MLDGTLLVKQRITGGGLLISTRSTCTFFRLEDFAPWKASPAKELDRSVGPTESYMKFCTMRSAAPADMNQTTEIASSGMKLHVWWWHDHGWNYQLHSTTELVVLWSHCWAKAERPLLLTVVFCSSASNANHISVVHSHYVRLPVHWNEKLFLANAWCCRTSERVENDWRRCGSSSLRIVWMFTMYIVKCWII